MTQIRIAPRRAGRLGPFAGSLIAALTFVTTVTTATIATMASILTIAAMPGSAQALTIDFEDYAHGEVVTGGSGFTITVDNFVRAFDYGVAFDSDLSGTADADLEADWSGGNLVGQSLGKILIIQENAAGCDLGLCTSPDDEGGRPAGTITVELDVATPIFGFDLIDVDSTMAENGALTLWDATGTSVSIDFATVLSGFDIGDNTANRVDPYVASDLGLGPIVKVEFLLGGSGGIDNLVVIPEPATFLLMAMGLLGLGLAGHHRVG